MNTGKVVLGTLAGIAIGAVGGILFAPKKGSETRKQMKDKADDYSDVLAEKLESTKKDAENLVEKGKSKFYDAKKVVKNAAADFEHDVSADFNHATS